MEGVSLTAEEQAELERLEASLAAPAGSMARGPRPTPPYRSPRKKKRLMVRESRRRNRRKR